MMAVMRKMLADAYRLLRTGEMYDPTKVGALIEPQGIHPPSSPNLAAVGA